MATDRRLEAPWLRSHAAALRLHPNERVHSGRELTENSACTPSREIADCEGRASHLESECESAALSELGQKVQPNRRDLSFPFECTLQFEPQYSGLIPPSRFNLLAQLFLGAYQTFTTLLRKEILSARFFFFSSTYTTLLGEQATVHAVRLSPTVAVVTFGNG